MKQLKIGLAQPSDAKKLEEWLSTTKGNLYDPDIFKAPTLTAACAYNEEGPVAYLPAQSVLVLESLAVKPGAPPLENGQAFRDLVKAMELVASQRQIREILFVCSDENVVKVAQNHGFEVLGDKQSDGSTKPWTTVRMKLQR
jgi:hypothetical protein